MFYAEYIRLCNEAGKTPSAVAEELGFKKSAVTKWKQGSIPTDANKNKIAQYFNISVAELLGDEQKEKPLVNNDEELTEYLEMLKNRSECRMLFKLAKTATKEDVEQTVKIIEAIRNK